MIDCLDGLPVAWAVEMHPDEQLVNEMLESEGSYETWSKFYNPLRSRHTLSMDEMDCSDRNCWFATINVEKKRVLSIVQLAKVFSAG